MQIFISCALSCIVAHKHDNHSFLNFHGDKSKDRQFVIQKESKDRIIEM